MKFDPSRRARTRRYPWSDKRGGLELRVWVPVGAMLVAGMLVAVLVLVGSREPGLLDVVVRVRPRVGVGMRAGAVSVQVAVDQLVGVVGHRVKK